MTPATIISQAQQDGVTLALSPMGTIKAAGSSDAVNRWLPVIREHKAELLRVLELSRELRLYSDRRGFGDTDFREAMQVAVAGNLDGWLAYIRGENETRH